MLFVWFHFIPTWAFILRDLNEWMPRSVRKKEKFSPKLNEQHFYFLHKNIKMKCTCDISLLWSLTFSASLTVVRLHLLAMMSSIMFPILFNSRWRSANFIEISFEKRQIRLKWTLLTLWRAMLEFIPRLVRNVITHVRFDSTFAWLCNQNEMKFIRLINTE